MYQSAPVTGSPTRSSSFTSTMSPSKPPPALPAHRLERQAETEHLSHAPGNLAQSWSLPSSVEKFHQGALRAAVMGFHLIQVLRRLHCGGYGHETVEASCVVRPVLVLRATVHGSPGTAKRLSDAIPNPGIDCVTNVTKQREQGAKGGTHCPQARLPLSVRYS